MNPTAYLVALTAPLAAVSVAAQETSQAEAHLRSAWWAEKGANDFERALQLYQRAVDATGPATVRADAAVRAGVMLHRLGRIQEALTALQSVQTRFPAEKGAIQQARRHLVELTAIDVEKDYTEWYRRHMFGEKVQADILLLIRDLAGFNARDNKDGRARRSEMQKAILAYDRAAVPALRETAMARSASLAALGMELLAKLGELPPPEAMARTYSWAGHSEAWRALLAMSDSARRNHLRSISGRSDIVARLALASPDQMCALLASDAGGILARENDSIPYALMAAMLEHGDARLAQRVIALADNEEVPLMVRRLVENTVMESNWRGATAADWLAYSRNRFSETGRKNAIGRAMQGLGREDAGVLDAILEELDGTLPQLRNMTIGEALYGLRENPVPLQLPWTPERLAKVIRLSASTHEGCGEFLSQFRLTQRGRELLLKTLFSEPAAIVDDFEEEGAEGELDTVGYGNDPEDEDQLGIQNAWSGMVAKHLTESWGQWSAEDRLAAIKLFHVGCAYISLPAAADARAFLRAEYENGTGSDELTELLESLVGDDG